MGLILYIRIWKNYLSKENTKTIRSIKAKSIPWMLMISLLLRLLSQGFIFPFFSLCNIQWAFYYWDTDKSHQWVIVMIHLWQKKVSREEMKRPFSPLFTFPVEFPPHFFRLFQVRIQTKRLWMWDFFFSVRSNIEFPATTSRISRIEHFCDCPKHNQEGKKFFFGGYLCPFLPL